MKWELDCSSRSIEYLQDSFSASQCTMAGSTIRIIEIAKIKGTAVKKYDGDQPIEFVSNLNFDLRVSVNVS